MKSKHLVLQNEIIVFPSSLVGFYKKHFSLQCYIGVSVNDVPVSNGNISCSCNGNTPCPVRKCSKLKVSGTAQNLVFQDCVPPEYCNQTYNSDKITAVLVTHKVNFTKNTEFPPATLECCDTDYCNSSGYGLLEGEFCFVFICIILVSFIF